MVGRNLMRLSFSLSWTCVCEELLPTVSLDALDREWHLLRHPVEESQRAFGSFAGKKGRDLVTRAVIDRGKMIQPFGDLADIHLDSVARYRSAIALPFLFPLQLRRFSRFSL